MKIPELYRLIIRLGIEADPRGKKEMERILKENRTRFEALKDDEKDEFDPDALFNPYADTRLLYDNGKDVKRILTGVDIDTAEVLLAERLAEKGRSIDLILAHHPSGYAYAGFHGVMHMQTDMLANLGVPINVAEGLLRDRVAEVSRIVAPMNHNKAVDAAAHLGIGFMCCHTPADNNVSDFLQKEIDRKRLRTVGDVVKFLKGVPEYARAVRLKAGPRVIVGSKENRAGKVIVDMTGGTSGSKDVYEQLADVGVGTIIMMHIKEEHIKEAAKHHINVIVAGHMASDSLGMNFILDNIEKRGIEVVPCSGLIRVKRSAKGKKGRKAK
jgi:putative NIF3 family GTP cyclohydrolase 1 type 2